MNDPYRDDTEVEETELDQFNAGTRRAIEANRDHEAREKHLDSLYFGREVTS